ncbi:peptide chain release factor N(5)-glutamine methyltransferase [Leucothrix arctica]|uniref:Release factor glutamine methyltransferase n=1 Tax=Leucothrix arctica TaxID=1481894 RepID=A0A317CKR3_9GAMM|nr:peptide chain release factor N(5)-glutamine methyltransferase [Leucothrix arctica]PWQ98929.1 peptide chain release factor N(5)-glutamine methyltransferase [Leucothrix arctica]
MRIDTTLKDATALLETHTSSPRLDAEILLSHFLDKNRSYLFAWPEVELTEKQRQDFNQALVKRKDQYPVAYLTGYQEFWSLMFAVNESVLIPRADTELLVETALEKLAPISNPRILELGTGSGAIALSLASERPDSEIVATDLSSDALIVAQHNKEALKITNVSFLQSDWFNQIDQTDFDLIISNPPYIDPQDRHMQTGIRFEPLSALCAEDKGLADLATITNKASKYLKTNGWLMLEHGYDQGDITTEGLKKAGYKNATCLKDLPGNDRITIGQLTKS